MAPKTPSTPSAVGYVRVSTDEQTLGPVAQEKAIRAWCTTHDVKLCSIHTDQGLSGGLEFEKRPALVEALDAVKQSKSTFLLVHKRDRVARDRNVIGTIGTMLRRMGCRIQTTDQDPKSEEDLAPMEQAMEGIADVFAELERAMTRARTKAALAVKRARGERVGTIPYGFALADDGIHLEKDDYEQEILTAVQELRKDGRSLRDIAAILKQDGYEPRTGKAFYAGTIKSMLDVGEKYS